MPAPPRAAVAAGSLLALCLALYLKPYYGIRHDSVLYLAQALHDWKPAQFGQDLFFAFGSQAQFTAFPALAGALLRHVPAGEAFLAITLAGRLCFVLASWFLVRRLLPEGYRFWALLAILVMPSGYGAYDVYTYGEAFATSRILAEPLLLVSLGAIVRRQWALAAMAWLAGAALHPLQSVPVALLAWVLLASRDRRWLHLVWPAVVAVALGIAGAHLPGGILDRYDNSWLGWIVVENYPVFVTKWRLADWCYLMADAFLVLLVARGPDADLGRIARALLATMAVALALSLILSDVLHFVLATGLQFWRAHWLLRWLAMACLPWLLLREHAAGPRDRPRLLLLVAIAVVGARQLPAPWAVLLLIPLYLLWPRIRDRIRPALGQLLAGAVLAGLLIIYLKISLLAAIEVQLGASRQLLRPEYLLVTQPPVMGALVVLGALAWRRGQTAARAGIGLVLVAWLAYAALEWDRRAPSMRDIEQAQGGPDPFGVALEPRAQVLWMKESRFEEALAVWLGLGRPSYFSVTQKAGLLFNRDTAQEAMARQAIVRPLEDLDGACNRLIAAGEPAQSCLLALRAALGKACRAAGGKLDYVVVAHELGPGALGRWPISIEKPGDKEAANYLYGCADLATGELVRAPAAPLRAP